MPETIQINLTPELTRFLRSQVVDPEDKSEWENYLLDLLKQEAAVANTDKEKLKLALKQGLEQAATGQTQISKGIRKEHRECFLDNMNSNREGHG